MDSSEARQKLATLYKEKIAAPLETLVEETNNFLPQVETLWSIDKRDQFAAATRKTVEIRSGKETFVAPDTLPSLASVARQPKALQDFFKAITDGKTEFTDREKSAATLRWEPLAQFADTMSAMQHALTSAGERELAARARMLGETAHTVLKEIPGRELDNLFLAAANQPFADTAAPVQDVQALQAKLASPLDNVVKKTEELTTLLAQLPEEDKAKLMAMTPDYRRQSTLNEPVPDDIIAALPGLAAGVQGLKATLEAVNLPKTHELTAEETKAAADPWTTTDALRMPVRALNAMLNALNTEENGKTFKAETLLQPGKYDKLLALSAEVTSGCWEIQKAMSREAAQTLQGAVKAFDAKEIASPPTSVENPSATPVNPGKDRGLT